jgi:hypothetical protein
MEKTEHNDKDDAQKAKLIFFSLAALVTLLLIWSLYSANKARNERTTALQEAELLKQDNAKLEQLVKEENLAIEDLRKKVQLCEAKAKAKPAPKAKPAKKTTKSKKHK